MNLSARLDRLERRAGSFCPECAHSNPPSDDELEELESQLRAFVAAFGATWMAATGNTFCGIEQVER